MLSGDLNIRLASSICSEGDFSGGIVRHSTAGYRDWVGHIKTDVQVVGIALLQCAWMPPYPPHRCEFAPQRLVGFAQRFNWRIANDLAKYLKSWKDGAVQGGLVP